MDCPTCREHLSADLDGESGPLASGSSAQAAYDHLAGCTGCSRWFATVTRINRMLLGPTDPGPGLSPEQLGAALSQLPRPTGKRRRLAVGVARVALAVVGAAQTVLGAFPLGVLPWLAGMGGHDMVLGAGMIHMSHEYSAWNLALGVGFLAGAARTRHLAGTLPVLASFVAVLTVLSAIDLRAGTVDAARVTSHALVLVGVVLVALIVANGRPTPGFGRPSVLSVRRVGAWKLGTPTTDSATRPARPLLGERRDGRPNPAARHRAA